jgi:hypothetical protein
MQKSGLKNSACLLSPAQTRTSTCVLMHLSDRELCIRLSSPVQTIATRSLLRQQSFFRFKFMHLNLTNLVVMLNPDDAPQGWRLIENTSIYLDDRDTFAFMATHSKACGIAGLVRHPLVDITTN